MWGWILSGAEIKKGGFIDSTFGEANCDLRIR